MAALTSSDPQLQQQPKKTGYRKKDINKKEAELALTLRNLKERRDKVVVTFPAERESPLVVRINDVVYLEKILPGAIVVKKCKAKIKYGEKAEVKVKLTKVEAEYWMHRWSPSRDQPGSTASPVHSLDQSRSASLLGVQSNGSPASRALESPTSEGNSSGPIITLLE